VAIDVEVVVVAVVVDAEGMANPADVMVEG